MIGKSRDIAAGGQPHEHSWLPNEKSDIGSDQPTVPARTDIRVKWNCKVEALQVCSQERRTPYSEWRSAQVCVCVCVSCFG